MAKYKEEVSLSHNIEVVAAALKLLHETEKSGWQLGATERGVIFLHEDASLLGYLSLNAVTLMIRLQPLSESTTQMAIEGTKFGLGPLNAQVIKKKTQEFKQKLQTSLETIQGAADAIAEVEIASGTRCPKCDAALPLGTRFCPNDGTEIAKACAYCDKLSPPSARFCVGCGKPL